MIPNDPAMLLSYVNTQLRDFYPSLELFCEEKGIDADFVCRKLEEIDYRYDEQTNRFV